MYSRLHNNDGFILVVMMLFLLVASLLAVSGLNMNLLEDRMNIFYQDKIRSFYQAENLLLDAERKILSGVETNDIPIIDMDICGVTFYRLTVEAEYHGAKSSLQSIFAKAGDFKNCSFKPNISSGRQSFLIVK